METTRNWSRLTFAAILALTLIGCGGGGSGTAAKVTNLKLIGVEVGSAIINAGHEVELKTTIQSNATVNEVSLAYVLINKQDWDQEVAQPRLHYFGEETVVKVTPGENTYTTHTLIPVGARVDRNWYLAVIVDPWTQIKESTKDDNTTLVEEFLAVTVADKDTDNPDVAIEYVDFGQSLLKFEDAFDEERQDEYEDQFEEEVGIPAMVLRRDADDRSKLKPPTKIVDPEDGIEKIVYDTVKADFGATIVMSTTGANSVTVGLFADLCPVYDYGDGVPVLGDELIPLLIWDAESPNGPCAGQPGAFENFVDTTIAPDELSALHVDLLIPGTYHEQFESGENWRKRVEKMLQDPNVVGFIVKFRIELDKNDKLVEFEDGNLDETNERDPRAADNNHYWSELVIVEDDSPLPDEGPALPPSDFIVRTGSGDVGEFISLDITSNSEGSSFGRLDGGTVHSPSGGPNLWFRADSTPTFPGVPDTLIHWSLRGPRPWEGAIQGTDNWMKVTRDSDGWVSWVQFQFDFTGTVGKPTLVCIPKYVTRNDGNDFTLAEAISGIAAANDDADGIRCKDIGFDKKTDFSFGSRDTFGLALKVHANAKMDVTGASGLFKASVPLSVFGFTRDIISFDTSVSVNPKEDDSLSTTAFELKFKLMGRTKFMASSDDVQYTLSKKFPAVNETYKKSKTFIFGGVPVSVEGSATAEFGLKPSVTLRPTNLVFELGPYGSISARASASVNFGVAKGTIVGNLTLLDNSLTAALSFELYGLGKGAAAGKELTGKLKMKVTNILTGPKGELALSASINPCAIIPFVSSCNKEILRLKIAGFSSFKREDVLFEKALKRTVCVLGHR